MRKLLEEAGGQVERFEESQRSELKRYPGIHPPDLKVVASRPFLVEVKSRYTPLKEAARLVGLPPERAISLESNKLVAYMMWERALDMPCYLFVLRGFPDTPELIRYSPVWPLIYLGFRWPQRVFMIPRRKGVKGQTQQVVFADFMQDFKALDLFWRDEGLRLLWL